MYITNQKYVNLPLIIILLFCLCGCGNSLSSIEDELTTNVMNTDLASKTSEEDIDEIDGNQRFSEAPLEYIEGELYDFINGKYLYNISYQSTGIIDSGIYQDTNMLILRGKCYYPNELFGNLFLERKKEREQILRIYL